MLLGKKGVPAQWGEWGKSAQSTVGAHKEHLMLEIEVFRKALLTSQLFLSCGNRSLLNTGLLVAT